uniref:Uncharacterized protein n=1 Tax=uncultured marine virus TaxID=186617 RepID=A0A0F7L6M1_9VIRU|nr:hypothetical protein [uncultured marine virus]
MALITATEVISLAFDSGFDKADKITDLTIESTEWEYIREALTENLYNDVVLNTGSEYDNFITTYLKPCLAYYVKYNSMDNIWMQATNRGINTPNAENATTVTSTDKVNYKTSVLNTANVLCNKMIDYVQDQKINEDNELFEDYGSTVDVIEEKKIIAGIYID